MAFAMTCECGEVARAETEDELITWSSATWPNSTPT